MPSHINAKLKKHHETTDKTQSYLITRHDIQIMNYENHHKNDKRKQCLFDTECLVY